MSDGRLLYLLVTEANSQSCDVVPPGPKYTRDSLRILLCMLGCKPRHAFKAMAAIFETVEATVEVAIGRFREASRFWQVHHLQNGTYFVTLPRQNLYDLISTTLAEHNYKISSSSDDVRVACSLRERRTSVTILLAGTSGTGKSTLASLLASRLGITTVLSTDSIRHLLRSFHSKEEDPLIWASTYSAGDCFDANKTVGLENMTQHERTIKGYKAQCEVVLDYLDRFITRCEANNESIVVEGVHLSINFVVKLMQRHPSIIPFLVYIKSEAKHTERMAVRARYMTLDPNANRYVRHMRNIRLIQDYLLTKADKSLIPKVENSNMDRSVGLTHLTVLGAAKRMLRGEPCLDAASRTAKPAHAEFTAVTDNLTACSKDILETLRWHNMQSQAEVAASSSAGASSSALVVLSPAERELSGTSDACHCSSSSCHSSFSQCFAGTASTSAAEVGSFSVGGWRSRLRGEAGAGGSMEGMLAAATCGGPCRQKHQVPENMYIPPVPPLADAASSDDDVGEHPAGGTDDEEAEEQPPDWDYGSMYESATDMTDMDEEGDCGIPGRPRTRPTLVMAMRCSASSRHPQLYRGEAGRPLPYPAVLRVGSPSE